MKTTYRWLESFVQSGKSPQELADVLTFSGTEVEHMEATPDGDTVYRVEVTSNRVDCLGSFGLAREIAACLDLPLRSPFAEFLRRDAARPFPVSIESDAQGACPFYTAQVIRGVRIGPSPAWLRRYLEAVGCASINNVVDITNFVMFELSQPLHAFDLRALQGERIVVRMARAGEEFLALNHRSYKLDPRDLVIADGQRAVALAGIMGGADSEIGEHTVDVLLESACFHAPTVKATGRRMDAQHADNLASESRYRFERGVDPQGAIRASERAASLIHELAGGVAEGALVRAGSPGDAWLCELRFRVQAVERVLGAPVPLSRCIGIFERLGLQVHSGEQGEIRVRVPSFRRDLQREIDLVEEIGRVHGLDRFEARMTLGVTPSRAEPDEEFRAACHDGIRSLGFDEIVSETFVPQSGAWAFSPWTEQAPLVARAPVNLERPCLRRTLLASLVECYAFNQHRRNANLRLYEISGVVVPEGASRREPRMLALVAEDFFAVKGAIEELCRRVQVRGLAFVAANMGDKKPAFFAAGQGGEFNVAGRRAGMIGMASAETCAAFGITQGCCVAEVDLEALFGGVAGRRMFVPLPRFPEVERDVAVVVAEGVSWAEIERRVRAAAGARLCELRFFDEFRGKQIARGRKSVAFSLRFRDDARTLTSEEVEDDVARVVTALKELGAELRA